MFDVALEDATSSGKPGGRGRGGPFGRGGRQGGGGDRGDRGGPNKRQKKDAKFGFGGKKRHAKEGDAMSSGDLSGFNSKKMKTGGRPGGRPGGGRPVGGGGAKRGGSAKRPGKSRRANAKF